MSCRAADDGDGDGILDADCWFGQVRLVFSFQEGRGATSQTRECLLIRWYDRAAFTDQDRHLCGRFEKLRWERVQKPAGEAQEEPGSTWVRYDVVELRKVVKAVYIQPHPSEPDTFFYNRYV